MKRTDLIQLCIIITGIFMGYAFIASLPSLLYALYNWFESGLRGGGYMDAFLSTFLLYGLYFLAAVFGITKSKSLAVWLCRKAQFDATINLGLNKHDLLFILFTGLGIYGAVQQLPKVLVNLFNKIKSNNTFLADDSPLSTSFIISDIITLLLFFTLVYYAGVFADFLAGKINNKEPEDQIADNNPTQ